MSPQHTDGLTHANSVADHPDGEVVGILPQISRAELVIFRPEDNRHAMPCLLSYVQGE